VVVVRLPRILACLIVLALTAAPASAACDGTPFPSSRQSLTLDGVTRSFIVRAPATYDGRTAAPVLFAFHPFGMNADYMASRVPVARTWRQAIVIYPNGSGQPQSWQTTAGERGDRDLRFFDAMLSWLGEHACVDAHRVFAVGYSNGAGFAYLLACERGAAIAGLAIASGRLECGPTQPAPVVINHGTADATIPYDAALDAAAAWATVNGCTAPPQPVPDRCAAAPSCSFAPVTLCTYPGGHEYNSPFTATAVDFLKGRR
jgi:polyhydroxybutyrate depolymerase